MYKRKRPSYEYTNSSKKRKTKGKHKHESDDESEDEDGGDGLSMLKKLLNSKVECIGNHIWFNDMVTSESVSKLIKVIHGKNHLFEIKQRSILFAKLQPEPLYLHINSDGGDLFEAMAAIDSIQNSKIPVYTVIDGRAASAATLMAIVGKRRFMTENSLVLIHQLSGFMGGKMTEMEDDNENNKFLMERLKVLYTKFTKLKRKQLNKMLKHDLWWDYSKCLKYGMVDGLYTNNNVGFS